MKRMKEVKPRKQAGALTKDQQVLVAHCVATIINDMGGKEGLREMMDAHVLYGDGARQ